MNISMRLLGLTLLLNSGLWGWSPRFHEAQTRLAVQLAPRHLAKFLNAHAADLMQGARGQSADQVPTVEEVEDQFAHIVELTELKRRPETLVRELGVLAHQVQLLMDPSAIRGNTPLRDAFEAYGDEKLPRLVLSREAYWAVTGPLDPKPELLKWANKKFERTRVLQTFYDEKTARRLGAWDNLSLPFAQLDLAYSNGVHATVNLWILLWRAVGDQWPAQTEANP
jgi:hypothetical protein